jgi:hypothetical protein
MWLRITISDKILRFVSGRSARRIRRDPCPPLHFIDERAN